MTARDGDYDAATSEAAATKWPKPPPHLTAEQIRIQDDWIRYFHERLPTDHPRVLSFNHRYPLRSARPNTRTLEVGAGLRDHLHFEDLGTQEYHAIELRTNMADAIFRFIGITATPLPGRNPTRTRSGARSLDG